MYQLLAIYLFVYIAFWFIISLIKKRNDIADLAWGLGFVFLAWSAYLLSDSRPTAAFISNVLITLWGLRLSLHIFNRLRDRNEDFRYLAWRKEWGSWFYIRSFFQVFLLQGILLYVVCFPAIFLNFQTGQSLSPLSILGVFVWIFGFYFEAVGDWQLAQYIKSTPEPRPVYQDGLWKYTRHPNYFGEITQWWGIFIIALNYPNSLFTIIGPLTISSLILFISGIPPLEKRNENKPGYQEYKNKTSIFFPLPPKN